MKKKIFTVFGLTIVCITAIFIASSIDTIGGTSVYASSSGSPGGKTNSPLDGANCTQCHSGTLNAGTGTFTITSNIPTSGYVPGNTYQITSAVLGTSSTKIGFEITSESVSAKAGTIIISDVTRTQTANSGNSVTHQTAGTTASGGANAWQFDWTAPLAGTGDVTFYGAFNVTNSNGNTAGDEIHTATYVVQEGGVGIEENNAFISISLYPNPATNFFQLSSTKNVESVEVFNLSGQSVLTQNASLEKINIEGLSFGVYFVKINSDKGTKVEKLTVN